MKYELRTVLRKIPEFKRLKETKQSYRGPLRQYDYKTVEEFIYDYKNKGLRGKAVYDELIKSIAPEEYKGEQKGPEVKIKVKPIQPERYSMEELLSLERRVLPHVSNMHQSLGKLMDAVIYQAIEILKKSSSPILLKYGDALKYYFIEHKSVEEIVDIIKDSKENIQGNMLRQFMKGKKYYANIVISNDFKQQVQNFMDSLLYKTCNTAFEDNDIDSIEKISFALHLSGYDMLNGMKEWKDAQILIADSTKNITRQHLISLKKAICDAIVPVTLNTLVENTKADFIIKNNREGFNRQIIESFVQANPWIKTDDEGKYYILTQELTSIYQRQGRIIYEAGGLIHQKEVKSIYESIYKETYKTPSIQNTLSKRIENDFFPYGKTGMWYYSQNGSQLTPTNEVLAKFVDEHKCFYWKDLYAIVSLLRKVDRQLNDRRIRSAITNLCYVDNNDDKHFVKKGEEDHYPSFSWSKGRQNRVNWIVNHIYEILKDTPNGEMPWAKLEPILTQDIEDTGRPLTIIGDVKYKLSGTANERRIFILEDDKFKLNEDVFQNDYNGNLSMYGLYRKYPQYYDSIYSLAMSELRKRQDNRMQLIDFINLAIESLKSDDVSIDRPYIRKMFENNDSLPNGLLRYNDNGTVYIKLDIAVADEETKDEVQYDVTTTSAGSDEVMPSLIVSETQRQPVTYATKFDWPEVKQALRKDLSFYDSPYWSEGITSDEVLDKFVNFISSSTNYNLNLVLPRTIYEFHYARIDRYDLNQYMLCLPIAFEALLRCINDSKKRPTYGRGISQMCEEWFPDYGRAIKYKEKKGFGKILNDMVHKRNLLLHGNSLELSPVTLVQNIVEYIALFVYTVNKYALDD